ncbi:MAG: hypothetical protein RLZZ169_629 [Pseudomonadota bacterium]|jgi:hypothetical protein
MRALRRYLLLLAAVTPVALWAAELPSAPGQTGSPGPASTTTGAAAAAGAGPAPAANPTADGAAAVSPETGAEADQTPGTMTANDTFVPTVEISEDLSVSFPADI